MKKLFTLAFCALLGGALWAASPTTTPANPFQDDLICLNNEFAGMTELEQLLEKSNITYAQLLTQNSPLLQYLVNDNQDISTSLLDLGNKMDSTLKTVLIVLGVLVVIGCGCLLISAIYGTSVQ